MVRRHAAAARRHVPVPGDDAALRSEAPGAHGLDPSVRAAGNAAGRPGRRLRGGGVVPRPCYGRRRAAEILLLPLLNDSGPVAQALRASVERGGGAHVAFGRHRRALLQPAGDAAHYVERAIGKKRHKEFQRLRRRLAESGPIAFEVARSPAAVAAALQDFLTLEAKGWKGAAGTALIQSPELRQFAETAVDALARQGQAGVARLLLRSRPIASIVTLQSGGGAWAWKIAYDESLARFSPGAQATMEFTEALVADDTVACADSCATPDHPMIDHLWRERLAMADLMIGLQPGARFAVACRLKSARRHAISWARDVRDFVRRGTR